MIIEFPTTSTVVMGGSVEEQSETYSGFTIPVLGWLTILSHMKGVELATTLATVDATEKDGEIWIETESAGMLMWLDTLDHHNRLVLSTQSHDWYFDKEYGDDDDPDDGEEVPLTATG